MQSVHASANTDLKLKCFYHLQGVHPSGIPSIWTTNDRSNNKQVKMNNYGEHCWMTEMSMDCSQTADGLFWVSASMRDLYDIGREESEVREGSLAASSCQGPHGPIDLTGVAQPARGHIAK